MSKRILILIFSFLIGCVNLESKDLVLVENTDLADDSPKVVEVTIDSEPFDLWERIRDDLTLTIPETYADTDRYRNRFVKNQHAVNRLSKSGQRYLFHTVKRAEELGVPIELALLPFVESEFDPYAQSLYGATGI